MNSRLWVAAALLSAVMGCDSGGDSKRTDLSCAPNSPYTDEACESVHSEVPLEMRCIGSWHSVPSCSDIGFVATCTIEEGPVSAIVYVYDDGVLGEYETMCIDSSGYWEEYLPI